MPQSQRIGYLKEQLDRGTVGAVERFWAEIEEKGSPLIEPFDETYALATFVFRHTPEASVLVAGFALGWEYSAIKLSRLEGTDLWYRTFKLPRTARFSYFQVINVSEEEWDASLSQLVVPSYQMDPLNRHPYPPDTPWASIVVMPDAPALPETQLPEGPAGTLETILLESPALGGERKAVVYLPPGYSASGAPCSLLLVFDGEAYQHGMCPPKLVDGLIAAGRIPPTVVVYLGGVFDQLKRKQEFVGNERFLDYVAEELLPLIRERYHVSKEQSQTAIMGYSFGGYAVLRLVARHPHRFGRVYAQSPHAYLNPEFPSTSPEPGALIRAFRDMEPMPIRWQLDVGELEGPTIIWKAESMIASTRHLRDVLLAKGYEVRCTTYPGGHDMFWYASLTGEGLTYLLGPA